MPPYRTYSPIVRPKQDVLAERNHLLILKELVPEFDEASGMSNHRAIDVQVETLEKQPDEDTVFNAIGFGSDSAEHHGVVACALHALDWLSNLAKPAPSAVWERVIREVEA